MGGHAAVRQHDARRCAEERPAFYAQGRRDTTALSLSSVCHMGASIGAATEFRAHAHNKKITYEHLPPPSCRLQCPEREFNCNSSWPEQNACIAPCMSERDRSQAQNVPCTQCSALAPRHAAALPLCNWHWQELGPLAGLITKLGLVHSLV